VRHTFGKAHLVGHHNHGHAFFGQIDHDIKDFLDHFRVERGCGFIEEHDLRVHAEAARNGHPLLLSAGKLARVFFGLLGDLNLFQVVHGLFFRFLLGNLSHPYRAEGQVVQDCQVRKQIEVLEYHAHFCTDLLDVFDIVGQLDAVDDNLPALVFFQAIDASDHGGFPGARRSADDDPLLFGHGQINALEHVKISVPFVHSNDFDHGLVGGLHYVLIHCLFVHVRASR